MGAGVIKSTSKKFTWGETFELDLGWLSEILFVTLLLPHCSLLFFSRGRGVEMGGVLAYKAFLSSMGVGVVVCGGFFCGFFLFSVWGT